MFVRLAAIALVASSFLSGAVAEPIPVPTPAPVPVERRGVLDFLTSLASVGVSLVNEGEDIFDDITGAVGSIATVVTSVGGEAATFITDIGGAAYLLADSAVDGSLVTVTSIGGQAYTVVKSGLEALVPPTSTPTTTKNAASPLRPISISLPITVSLVSTILSVGLGARFVI